MKKLIIIQFVVIVLLFALCSFLIFKNAQFSNNHNAIANGEYSDIDKKLQVCNAENFMTSGMNSCTNVATESWLNVIKENVFAIENTLPVSELNSFRIAQNAWLFYYQKEKDFLNTAISESDGDTHTTFAIGYIYELTKQRALMLKNYYRGLNN